MTPKEKAEQLYSKYLDYSCTYCTRKPDAKQCALIAVDEILRLEEFLTCFYGDEGTYWQEVKNEIEKL